MMHDGLRLIGLSLTIKLPLEEEDALDKLVKQLAEVRLKLKTVSEISLAFKTIRDLIPRIMFTDDNVSIQLARNELEINIGQSGTRRISVGRSEEEERASLAKTFEKNNLLQLSSELNYLIGIILGQIQTAKKPSVEGNLVLELSDTKYSFDHLLGEKIMLNGNTEAHLDGLQLVTSEELFGTKFDMRYRFIQTQDKATARVVFSFELLAPLDLSTITYTLLDKVNNALKLIQK